MAHLTADQFVDVADGVRAETDMAHLASCADCRRQLADLRAMMTEAAGVEAPEPSPLYWDHLSARVRDAVAAEATRARSWRERWLRPHVWIPALAGALAVAVLVALQPREALSPPTPSSPTASAIPATPSPVTVDRRATAVREPALPPLGSPDDPQLGLVADYGTSLGWDEMRDEIAFSVSGPSSDAVLDSLTVDEQRELQRLLADEMSQPAVPENRS